MVKWRRMKISNYQTLASWKSYAQTPYQNAISDENFSFPAISWDFLLGDICSIGNWRRDKISNCLGICIQCVHAQTTKSTMGIPSQVVYTISQKKLCRSQQLKDRRNSVLVSRLSLASEGVNKTVQFQTWHNYSPLFSVDLYSPATLNESQ